MPFTHPEIASVLYRPLIRGNLRLIKLSPRVSGILSCDLWETSLEQPIPYEALSYVWGDPTDTVSILVSGHEFAATKNLESGLRHLQFEHDARVLWVDSICINQLDEDEKSKQIPATAQIYGQATNVCAWLGTGFSTYPAPYLGTAEILRYLLADEHVWNMRTALGFCGEDDEVEDGGVVSKECARRIGTSNPFAVALVEISSCPYWRRVWELAASSNVQFYLGTSITTLAEMSGIIKWSNKHIFCCQATPGMFRFDFLDMAGKLFQNKFTHLSIAPESFIMSLHSAQGSEASIPKDRYFALQYFSSPSSLRLPDYRLDNASIAKFVTRQHIAHTGQLIMLALALGPRSSHWAAPSWAYDLQKCDGPVHYMRLRFILLEGWRSDVDDGRRPRFPRFNADNGEAAELVQSSLVIENDDTLPLKGVKLGRVIYIDAKFPDNIPDNEENLNLVLKQAAGRLWRCNQHAGPRRTNSQDWDSLNKIAVNLGRLMTFDEIPEIQQVDFPATSMFGSVEETAMRQQSMAAWFEAAANGSLLSSYRKDKLRVMLLNHRFCPFVLEDGKIGMFSGDVQVGDVVCILDGSGFPFVLRPTSSRAASEVAGSEPTLYRLVGRAYVQEAMYGEAVVDGTGMPRPREVIHLC